MTTNDYYCVNFFKKMKKEISIQNTLQALL